MTNDGAARAMAQDGLHLIENAIVALLELHPQGLRNVEIAESLGLVSDFRGGSRNFLTYSVLGGLLSQGTVAWNEESKFFVAATRASSEKGLAQSGLARIEQAILALLERNSQGLRNIEIASSLDLRSDFRGGSRNYLTYSVLGRLLAEGKVAWDECTKLFTKA